MSNDAYGKWIATVKGEPNAKEAFKAGYEAGINESQYETVLRNAVDGCKPADSEPSETMVSDETESSSSEDEEPEAKPKKKAKTKTVKKKKR